jgi:predicted DNA-binding antitoxin AbrB/MazE fold protein
MRNNVHNKHEGVKSMGGTVRAVVRDGRLEPLERIELPEGKEVTITVLDVPSIDAEAFRRAAGRWKGSIDATS